MRHCAHRSASRRVQGAAAVACTAHHSGQAHAVTNQVTGERGLDGGHAATLPEPAGRDSSPTGQARAVSRERG